MKLDNIKIGLCITGSFCNFERTKEVIDELKNNNANITPIISEIVRDTSTRFYDKNEFIHMLEERTGNRVLDTICKTEPIGPKNMFDILLILPCTGNTLGKISNGISDSCVTMAVKSHIRNNKRVVVGISTNDGLR
ncbi:MAG: dipicolinate synthase subunit B [Clostridia bacterium]